VVGRTPGVVVVLFPSSDTRSRFLARPLFLASLTRARSTSPSRLPSPSFFLSSATAAAIASAARERGGRRGREEAGKGRGKGSAERHPLDEVYQVNERNPRGVRRGRRARLVVFSVYTHTRASRREQTRGVSPHQRRRKSQPLSSANAPNSGGCAPHCNVAATWHPRVVLSVAVQCRDFSHFFFAN